MMRLAVVKACGKGIQFSRPCEDRCNGVDTLTEWEMAPTTHHEADSLSTENETALKIITPNET